jgi:CTP:molybdopterin cytidylyltransferase MocA
VIAVVTAGGRVAGPLAEAIGTDIKALAQIGGRTLLETALVAAREAGARRLLVVGGPAVRAQCGSEVDDVLDEAGEGRENVRRAMLAVDEEELLLLTSDMPFVDAAALKQFVAAAAGVDVALPVASGAEYERAFPGAPPHVTNLGGERIANGNVVYFAAGATTRVLPIAQQLFDARKSLWRMALLGPALLTKFALRRLHISDVEARAQQKFGVRARACRDLSPSLCFDIDTNADYQYARERFARG